MRGRPGTRRGSKSAKKSARSKTARAQTGRAATKKAAKTKKTTKKSTKNAPTKKKVARKTAAPARKKTVTKKSGVKRTTKRTPRAVRKDVFGEGNYTAAREFRDQETKFVRRNRNKIESMGEEAEAALEGDEGEELEEAEGEARSHTHSPGD